MEDDKKGIWHAAEDTRPSGAALVYRPTRYGREIIARTETFEAAETIASALNGEFPNLHCEVR